MPTCSFCKKNYEFPRGLTVFTFDGKSIHFCSSKCQRNMKLKRDPKKVNWVKRKKKAKKLVRKKQEDTDKQKKPEKPEKPEKKPEKSSEIQEKK